MNGVIISNIAPLHRGRSDETEQVTQAILGTPISILDQVDGWSKVRLPDTYTGWLEDKHWVEKAYPGTPMVAEITDLFANLRAQGTYLAAPRAIAPLSAALEWVSTDGDDYWVELRLPDGRPSWVEKRRVRIRPADEVLPSPTREGLVATAKRLLKTPYLWGGVTPLGIDCSGYVQLCYKLNGLQLVRDAGEQEAEGTPVEKSDLLPGDLVYFGQPDKDGIRQVTHVGMAIENGDFIHAQGGNQVTITPLEEEKYAKSYMFSRRYIKD